MEELIEIAVGFFLLLCAIVLVFFAGSLAAICVFGAGAHGLISTFARGVGTRGGANALSGPDEPAFRAYYRVQVWRDLLCALRAGRRRVEEERTKIVTAVPPRAGSLGTLFRVVMWIYGWYAFLLGGLLAVVIGGFLALVLLVVSGFALLVGAPLRTIEALRRGRLGAHFDCPTCHDRFALPVYACPVCGARHRRLVSGPHGVLHRRCTCGAVLPSMQLTGRHHLPAECPARGHSLGEAVGTLRTVHVPVAGGISSGKTAFLAAAMAELERCVGEGSLAVTIQESSRAGYDGLMSGFRRGAIPPKTADTMAPALAAEISGRSHAALLYAYDVAGEAYARDEELRRDPAYGMADCVVLLVDPFALERVRVDSGQAIDALPQLRPSPEAPQRVLERLLGVLLEKGADVSRLPLAICVTKVDALQVRAAIDASSGESEDERVRAWLEEAGAGNLLRSADGAFATVRCFALSALGRLADAGEGPFLPEGALAPLLWALERYGVRTTEPGVAGETVSARLGAASRRSYIPKRPLSRKAIDGVKPHGYLANFGMGLAAFVALTGVFSAVGAATRSGQPTSVSGASGVAAYTESSTGAARSSGSSPAGGSGSPPSAQSGTGSSGAGTPTASSAASSARAARARERTPEGVMRRHLQALRDGHYAAAFALFSARYREHSPNWQAQPQASRPRINIVSLGPARVHGGEAYVHVRFIARDSRPTAASDTHCRQFDGEAHLIRERGVWRYDAGANKYQATVLDPSSSGCP